jgi:hypothetical protein
MSSSRSRSLLGRLAAVAAGALLLVPASARALQFDYTTFFTHEATTNLDVDTGGKLYVGTLGISAVSGARLFTTFKIDPAQSGSASLVWSRTFAAQGTGQFEGLAVDAQGRVALVGFSDAADFPVVDGYDVANEAGGFVTVLDATGQNILYSTRLGRTLTLPSAVAFAGGKVYVTGLTTDDSFPQRGGLVTGKGTAGNVHAFLSVFDPALDGDASLVYSTTLGDATFAAWLDLDAGGDAYLLGHSTTTDPAQIPTTAGAFQSRGDTVWVARLDPTLSGDAALIYATYLGGSGIEETNVAVGGLAVDGAGNAFVTGATTSTDFPTTADAPRRTAIGGVDLFVSALNPSGSALVYSTYLGGPADDTVSALALHPDGSVALTGYTASGWAFGHSDCARSMEPSATHAGYLARLSADGSALVFSDFLEDSASTGGLSLAGLNNSSTALLATGSAAIPLVDGFQARGSRPEYLGVLRTDDACANLAVTLPGVPSMQNALVGDVVPITVRVDNPGPTAVDGVRLTLDVDSDLTVLGGLGPAGDCTLTVDGAACEVGRVDVGGHALLALWLRPDAAAALFFTAVATTTDVEQAPANNTASAGIQASAASGPCGVVTYQGSCTGTVLRYCQDRGTPAEFLQVVDCATVFPDVTGQCAEVDPVYGRDCVVPLGESCFYYDGGGNPVFSLCAGATSGCVLDDTTGQATCQDLGQSCAAPVGASFAPVCAGDLVVVECNARQPVAYDCAALGGTCFEAVCVALPPGAPCDATTLQCDPGLVCHAPTGTCVAPAAICDPASFVATCSGSVSTTCDASQRVLRGVDCATIFTSGTGACGARFTCLDSGDGACAGVAPGCHGAGEGAPCDLASGLLCGPGFGCLVESDGQGGRVNRCRAVGTCAHGERHIGCVGDVATTCYGNSLITAAEASGVDCAAYGSRCAIDVETGNPECVGRLGGACDPQDPQGLFGCPPGLECTYDATRNSFVCLLAVDGGYYDAADDDAAGTDAAGTDATGTDAATTDAAGTDAAGIDVAPGPDGGVPPDSGGARDAGGGGDDDDDDEGCGCGGGCGDCAAAGSARTDALLLGPALAALLLRRRRAR